MAKTLATLLTEAGTQLENREFATAATLYREAIKLQPDNAAVVMGMAMLYNQTGRPEQALQLLQSIWKSISTSKAKRAQSPKAALIAQMGLAMEQLGRLPEALQNYKQAYAQKPSPELAERIQKIANIIANPLAIEQIITRATFLLRTGKLDEAEQAYHAALQVNPDYPEALHGLGLTLRARKDYNGALPLIQQAIILNPDRADYYNDLGMLFQDRGELEKAVSFHKRALKIDVDFAPAQINLGVAYKRLGKLDEAIAAYRQAIKLQPNSPAAHNNLGNLLRIQGDFTGASKELKQAIKLQPGYKDAIENLAAVEKEEAIAVKKTPRKPPVRAKKTSLP